MVVFSPAEGKASAALCLEAAACAGGVAACSAAAAAALAAADTGSALVAALRVRQADDDHVLQTVYAFYNLLLHPASADYLINSTGMLSSLFFCIVMAVLT